MNGPTDPENLDWAAYSPTLASAELGTPQLIRQHGATMCASVTAEGYRRSLVAMMGISQENRTQ